MGGGMSLKRKANNIEGRQNAAPIDSSPVAACSQVVHTLAIASESPLKKTLIAQMSLNIIVSPRRELALRSSVPFTPIGKEASIYRYYCPLCMEFFESILKTKCCGNYICLKCTIEYLKVKGLLNNTLEEIIGNTALKCVNCPNCFTLGFNPQLVKQDDSIRDYSREVTGDAISSNGLQSPGNVCTPLKIGDTFEDLKRKMIPFAVMKAVSSTFNEQGIAMTVRRSSSTPSPGELENDRRPRSLHSMFDSIAVGDEGRSTAERSINLSYLNDESATTGLIIECIQTLQSGDNREVENDTLQFQPEDDEHGMQVAQIEQQSENMGVQINVNIQAQNPDEINDVLDIFLNDNSSLKKCCRKIAGEMMRNIIEGAILKSEM